MDAAAALRNIFPTLGIFFFLCLLYFPTRFRVTSLRGLAQLRRIYTGVASFCIGGPLTLAWLDVITLVDPETIASLQHGAEVALFFKLGEVFAGVFLLLILVLILACLVLDLVDLLVHLSFEVFKLFVHNR